MNRDTRAPLVLAATAALVVLAWPIHGDRRAPQSASAATPAAQTMAAGLQGWELVTEQGTPISEVVTVRPDGVIAVAGSPVGYLSTTASRQAYRVHAEWRWPGKTGNGGALVHIRSGPTNGAWPVCYQVQWKFGAVGDLLPMNGATFAEALSTPPDAKTPQRGRNAADSERPAGEWNTCDIVCAGRTITASINGVVQNRVTGLSVSAGKVGFQLEGTPFEMRNIRIAGS
jgi:hypothetical protein